MSYYTPSRNVELSTIKYIEDNITADWTGITVVKSFARAYEVDSPVICVELIDTAYQRQEIGNTEMFRYHSIAINVFGTSDGQRLDVSDYLITKLLPGWTYYTISQSSGNLKTLTWTPSGRIHLNQIISNNKVDFGGDEVKDRYRQTIVILVEKST